MLRFGSGLVVVILSCTVQSATAQGHGVDASRHLSAGVHDFYRGRYLEAIKNLDMAAGYDGQDPRTYFFRGLAKLRLGHRSDASTDFTTGSHLEAALKRSDVGRALHRVQGPDRLLIERYRREARQLPEQVVRKVLPQPVDPTVQRQPPGHRQLSRAARARFAAANLPADDSDPFRADAGGLLGRGELEVVAPTPGEGVAVQDPSADGSDNFAVDDFGGDEPFGTGVVAETDSADYVPDPFALDDDADPKGSASDQASGAKTGLGGMFGAAARAFSRAVAPATGTAEQGGTDSDNPFGEGASSVTDDLFGDASSDDSDEQPKDAADPPEEDLDDPFSDDLFQ